jgi:hypothetical protein
MTTSCSDVQETWRGAQVSGPNNVVTLVDATLVVPAVFISNHA